MSKQKNIKLLNKFFSLSLNVKRRVVMLGGEKKVSTKSAIETQMSERVNE